MIRKSILGFAFVICACNVNAAPIFTNSQAVTTPTNTATFDALITDGNDLTNYSEDGINVTTPGGNCCSVYLGSPLIPGASGGLHYESGGNYSWVTISMQSGAVINALDFLIGDGWLSTNPGVTNLIWETFVGTTSTGLGSAVVAEGSTVGWTDTSGFTSIHVAAVSTNGLSFGAQQAIALDNLRVGASGSVPEPATIALMGLGLAGIGWKRRKAA
ncbi:MAG: PEP-CTERM sorting domain-containing protein [Sedimenticola sp.]